MQPIATVAELEAIYGATHDASTVKEAPYLTPHYRALIEASPFVLLATAGPEGLDCSPRGDAHGIVRIHDEKTLMLPDWRGNNRVDSLRNIVRDPRVALLFLIPGLGNTLRVNGKAIVTADEALCRSFAVGRAGGELLPRSVMVMTIDTVFFQCARAIVRADLWNPQKHVDPKALPTAGQILAAMSNNSVGGETYDRDWPERAKNTLW